ncbi:lysosomal acid glucosylceramidase-like [Colletes gigas]|uniref:lysosomal acid glucosylceramidase-like n=1 Tax=Colletes gigas TaxID=935657 RepID=UPI001C9BB0F8|nr:lysosomal acid glucosylceramidase-like [Colletes gigas]
MWKTLLIATCFLTKVSGFVRHCVPYTVGTDVVACVCNATYCDDTPYNVPKIPPKGSSYVYVTNKKGLRMKMFKAKFNISRNNYSDAILTVDPTKKYQTILGFGGTFTDSFGAILEKLSLATQNQIIRTYFCKRAGSRYSLGRIPIAGTDFSTRPYSYDDVANDTSLEHFALTYEDYAYKIRNIQKALQLNSQIKFVASPWSAPGWMKTNGEFSQFGCLKEEYYQTYADYLAKFVDKYKRYHIDIWAVTTGNEPTIAPQLNVSNIITMGWTPESMASWVGDFLGPALESSMNPNTVVLALDDNRNVLSEFAEPLFRNEDASKYTVGAGVHWYFDKDTPATILDEIHEEFPDKLLLMTEASIGPSTWKSSNVATEAWNGGEKYILSIIEYMNHWSVGWIDWNLALDEEGGPSWANMTLDAAIIVNTEDDVFYKLPAFYAIRHFSRFVDRDSVRISITDTPTIKTTAFSTTSEEIVVVLYNSDSSAKTVTLKDARQGALQFKLSPYSMNTVIYKS